MCDVKEEKSNSSSLLSAEKSSKSILPSDSVQCLGRLERIADYSPYLSESSKRRTPSAIRKLQPLMALPGMLSLGGGLPNGETFPLSSMTVGLKDGTSITIPQKLFEKGLQYSPSYGLPELVQWLREHQKKRHSPKYEDWSICVTTGSQDGLSKAFEMLLNCDDYILVENPCYPGTLAALRAITKNVIGLPTDEDGIIPAELERILSNWDTEKKRPRVLYTVPTGSNPSGATLPQERKEEIYRIACDYDLILLEDDPYYYLSFSDNNVEGMTLPPRSFLSIDYEGRVLRFDSFSKVLSAGVRIGFVTGPDPLVEKIQLHVQASTLHSAGMSQVLVYTLLSQWGMEGFEKHISEIQSFYRERRDKFASSMTKYLSDIAEWNVPKAGFFMWVKFPHVMDAKAIIEEKALQKMVLLVPGQEFDPADAKSNYVRMSYSVISEEDMDTSLSRVADMFRDHGQAIDM